MNSTAETVMDALMKGMRYDPAMRFSYATAVRYFNAYMRHYDKEMFEEKFGYHPDRPRRSTEE